MTNTRSFLAKVSAIACLGLCKRLYLEPPYVLGACDDSYAPRVRISVSFFVGGDSCAPRVRRWIESQGARIKN
jgi:hypothetical protein